MIEEKYMKAALELALKGTGFVSPNPRVGAVIVKNDTVIGTGWHRKFGLPHAEVEAIKDAGLEDYSDCDIYVNLEPCSHFGKTPPCSELLIQKKFKRVIIGTIDINPAVAGKGIQKLRDAGIEVVSGVLEEESKYINRFFFKHISSCMPYIIAKSAQSIDGCIATCSGESKWISSEESRKEAHKLRAECDAVLVGKKTAEEDNPSLNVRLAEGRNPRRIVLDSKLELPSHLKLFNDELKALTIVACSPEAYNTEKKVELEKNGVTVVEAGKDEEGKLNLKNLFSILAKEHNITSILSEGGASVNSYLLQKELIDEMHFFIEPLILGDGKASFAAFHTISLNSAPKFRIKELRRSGSGFQAILLK